MSNKKYEYVSITDKDLENLPFECWYGDEKRIIIKEINRDYCVERYLPNGKFLGWDTQDISYILSRYCKKVEVKPKRRVYQWLAIDKKFGGVWLLTDLYSEEGYYNNKLVVSEYFKDCSFEVKKINPEQFIEVDW